MSQFLAPIHTWLFNKIVILEGIEKNIEKQFQEDGITSYHQEIKKAIGDYLPEVSLEEQIDPSNIHGWLQDKIIKAETRQAAFINKIMSKDDTAVDRIKSIYYEAGVEAAGKLEVKIENPSEIFKQLNDVLLEGMPCDRVNSVLEQAPEKCVWETVHCVHKNNWESNGVDVSFYYGFRAALIEGYVNTISEGCTYSWEIQPRQIHTIAHNKQI